MANIQDDILEDFCLRLSRTDGFSPGQVQQIKDLLNSGKKPKAADLIKVLSEKTTEVLP